MDADFVRQRITQLRMQRGISEYKMSLDLGHSRSYMQSISSGRMMPSLTEFLYICEYLNVSPRDFFDEGDVDSALIQRAVEGMRELKDQDIIALLGLIDRLRENKS